MPIADELVDVQDIATEPDIQMIKSENIEGDDDVCAAVVSFNVMGHKAHKV
jgi:hypothetical protein